MESETGHYICQDCFKEYSRSFEFCPLCRATLKEEDLNAVEKLFKATRIPFDMDETEREALATIVKEK